LVRPENALPSRAEVVALSDQLAVFAAHLDIPKDVARLTRLAADLRTRNWRLRRVEADAREALELYQNASRIPGVPVRDACAAARAHAGLLAELQGDPALLYREAFVAARLYGDGACGGALERVVRQVSAYRPPPEAMIALEAEIAARRPLTPPAKESSSLFTADDAGVVLSPSIESAQLSPVQVRSIEPYGSPDRARIVISLTGPSTFEVGQLPRDPPDLDGGKLDRPTAPPGSGPRLFVDLARARPGKVREVDVGGLVERVRIASRGQGSRVVLDLAGVAYRRVFYLPEPFRVIIDVAAHPPQVATPLTGSPRRIARVALDPGHGGSDAGAVGPSGLREKEVTLDIAHRVAPVLARELGILTLLTRDGDRYVGLDERTARANAFHADLFVSIHCNAAENPSARGVMSFVLDTTRDEIAGRIAARENATSAQANADVASIISDLRLSDLGTRSTHLAELLQKTTVASLAGAFGDTLDQGVKTAGFFVLVGAEMPSVLYETSFISNPTEETRLGRAEYRQRLADALVNAIKAFREGR